ncbi:ATP-binding protein [Coralloluteibacterium thermophilus]|uniref:histidine kinase n=1 Tax=Coralloluteibacterium thermophilum TaxID=2707049 RepID=A0ABV9NQ34_9GAMM
MSARPPSFIDTLARLRWVAVAGQSVTVLVVDRALHLPLHTGPLWAGIGALALFNLYAHWRGRQAREASSLEGFLHVCVDIVVLAWLVAWSGGVGNPFSSLFLMPIALAALALPLRWVWATGAASLAGYAVSAWAGQPLPHAHGVVGYDLHLWGMVANVLVSVGVVLFFLTRLAGALREGERELARLREQFARDEGIIALATHAASVAHELNTPLGTLTLMLDDLGEHSLPAEVLEDCAAMRRIVDVCRDRVRELAAPAHAEGAPATVDIERIVARWQLVRPAVDLHRGGELPPTAARVDPGVGHLLQVLLNNAADASARAGSTRVDLHLTQAAGRLVGEVRDYGAGFDDDAAPLPARMFRSTKPDGLGVGLALSHATVERLGGQLSMGPADGPGARVRFELPLEQASA